MSTKLKTILAVSSSVLILAACQGQDAGQTTNGGGDESETSEQAGGGEQTNSGGESSEYSMAMVTDEGGVDDRSFNQSAWEGMQEWSEETGGNVEYYQSDSSADFIPNLNTAVSDGYDIIYAIGFLLEDSINQVAEQNPDQYFGLVDAVSDQDNVVSMTFRDHEAAFLAGVAAAHTTETDSVGFVGGIASPVIDRFETGFTAGVEYVDDSIDVQVDYAESFSDAGIGQQIANAMFTNDADVVYHAAGAVGNGVFTAARNRLEENPDDQIWVVGVDRDQSEEGEWSGGNFTLTSTVKGVGNAVQSSTNDMIETGFEGGEETYGLAEDGVGVTRGKMSEEAWSAVEEARQGIMDEEIEVPEFTYSE